MWFSDYKTILYPLIILFCAIDIFILTYTRKNNIELDNYYYLNSKAFNHYTRDFLKIVTVLLLLYYLSQDKYVHTITGVLFVHMAGVVTMVFSFVRYLQNRNTKEE